MPVFIRLSPASLMPDGAGAQSLSLLDGGRKGLLPLEALVNIYWDLERNEFFLHVPATRLWERRLSMLNWTMMRCLTPAVISIMRICTPTTICGEVLQPR